MFKVNGNEIKLPFDHHFLEIGIGTYSTMYGSHKSYALKLIPTKREVKAESFYKIILSGIFNQTKDIANNVIPTTLELIQEKSFLFSGIFLNSVERRNIYICIAVIMDLDIIKTKKHCIPIITEIVSKASENIKYMIKSGANAKKSMLTISPYIREIYEVVSAGIKIPGKIYNIITNNHSPLFLAACLQAHLSCGMRTIIESSNESESRFVFNFLSRFLLDFQLDLSSTVIHNDPVPHLYLQCVKKCECIPKEKLLNFERSFAWINVRKEEVYVSPNFDLQLKYHRKYKRIDESDEEGLKSILDNYEIVLQRQTKFSLDIVNYVLKVKPIGRAIVCQHIMESLVMKSIVLAEYVRDLSYMSQITSLQQDHIEKIATILEIEKPGHLDAVVAIASLFNDSIYSKVFSKRKEVITQMIASI